MGSNHSPVQDPTKPFYIVEGNLQLLGQTRLLTTHMKKVLTIDYGLGFGIRYFNNTLNDFDLNLNSKLLFSVNLTSRLDIFTGVSTSIGVINKDHPLQVSFPIGLRILLL